MAIKLVPAGPYSFAADGFYTRVIDNATGAVIPGWKVYCHLGHWTVENSSFIFGGPTPAAAAAGLKAYLDGQS